jgi:hypothetical protein
MPNKPIPPLIENWINELGNTNNNLHIRTNYKNMLENVRDACDAAVKRFLDASKKHNG